MCAPALVALIVCICALVYLYVCVLQTFLSYYA